MANAQNVERNWYIVDADGMTLGRLASQVAAILRGKNKPTFTPHVDCGDHVIGGNLAEPLHQQEEYALLKEVEEWQAKQLRP